MHQVFCTKIYVRRNYNYNFQTFDQDGRATVDYGKIEEEALIFLINYTMVKVRGAYSTSVPETAECLRQEDVVQKSHRR